MGKKPCYDHLMGSGKGKVRRAKVSTAARVAKPVVDKEGNKEWRERNGQLHRVGGPAREYVSGGSEWWEHGDLHRVGGPAIVMADGTKEWWENGQCHRVGGPAVEFASGGEQWWAHGKEVDPRVVRRDAVLKRLGEVELEPLEKVTF